MGRPKNDPALNELAGNPGKRKPRAASSGARPEALRWRPTFRLTTEAARLFNALAKGWADLGYIRESDMPSLTRYAELLAIWKEANEVLRPVSKGGDGKYIDTPMTNGGTMKRIHPAFNVMTRTESQLQSLEAQFGFTPAARYSILAKLAAQVPGASASAGGGDETVIGGDVSPLDFFTAQSASVQ